MSIGQLISCIINPCCAGTYGDDPVKYWVGVTDNRWFSNLQDKGLDEVNFWQPSATPLFKRPPAGMPFLFKLKRPYNHIAGGGFYVTTSVLPLHLAWEVFGEKNGASSLAEFSKMVGALRGHDLSRDVGCTVLANPFFFPQNQWLEKPPEWSPNIVRGKHYDTGEFSGAFIWRHFREVMEAQAKEDSPQGDAEILGGYGEESTYQPRIGQSSFRVMVTDAYRRRCAMTGENTLVTLEAAHIKPFAQEKKHDVRNGLLLRADFHRLFDTGLVGIDPDYKIRISPKIHELYFNGKAYYRLDGKELTVLPHEAELKPDREKLDWHMQHCFQAS